MKTNLSSPPKIFHLAIPSSDLDQSQDYYVNLGCHLARRYEDRVTLEFFGHQIVCHLAPEAVNSAPQMYPRHFGITFRDRVSFDEVLCRAQSQDLKFFKPLFIRFEGRKDEHRSFFLADPSNNLIEFKHYVDSAMMY